MSQLSYCAELVQRLDNDRFVCTLFAPPPEREALAALYAFNAEVSRIRESVREPLLGHMRLQWWREAVAAIYADRPPHSQVTLAVAEAVRHFNLSRSHFDRLLDARAFDLEDTAPATLQGLIDYAEGTSSTLAILSVEVLCGDNHAAKEAARNVGIAWALTGLIRALPFHARTRRMYLPAELNHAAGLHVFRLFEEGPSAGLCAVVQMVAASARDHLALARRQQREVPERCLPALLPATLAEGYLNRLANAQFNPFDQRMQRRSPVQLLSLVVNRWRHRF